MKTRYAIVLVLAAAGTTYFSMSRMLDMSRAESQKLKTVLTETQENLLGHTSYTSYMTSGKESLQGQMKLLAATVVREEGVTQVIERVLLPGLSSSGTVAIWYSVEYSFGFDLQPHNYDVRATADGIEVRVKKPTLLATPAVTNLRYKVLAGGMLTDEKAAALKLYEEAAIRAKSQGTAMAMEPPVLALCEKKIVDFLHAFLAKQPGVKVVPQIRVVYQ